ncbi:MAG: DUF721 domain-containing protein [Hyphomicrobiaceae bacterium]|nr:DUF721 domain-containing protein [Hyphomicrobiaceae bacterium]
MRDDGKQDGNRASRVAPAPPAGRHGRGVSARALGSLIPQITQKSFEKHGFAAASLIMDWPAIVGAHLAAVTRPLKLKWPRGIEKYGEVADDQRGRPGATLVLQVDPALALDVEYQAATIKDRINAYFGYRAVAELKIVQEAFSPAEGGSRASHDRSRPDAAADEIRNTASEGEDPLAAALARLGRHVAQSRKSD